MINGYTINNIREIYGVNEYQCFIIGVLATFDEEMTVTRVLDLAKHKRIACLATVHRAIMKSIESGLIKSIPTKTDKRTKVLTLTAKANNYLSDLNKGVKK
jgi:DNA-binding MarR family transcriptional regulator